MEDRRPRLSPTGQRLTPALRAVGECTDHPKPDSPNCPSRSMTVCPGLSLLGLRYRHLGPEPVHLPVDVVHPRRRLDILYGTSGSVNAVGCPGAARIPPRRPATRRAVAASRGRSPPTRWTPFARCMPARANRLGPRHARARSLQPSGSRNANSTLPGIWPKRA